MDIDLDAILDIVDGYEERKNAARDWYVRHNIPAEEHIFAHQASLSVDESSKAFEALRSLVARVRVLERQREWLATFIDDNMDCERCPYFTSHCTDCFKWVSQQAEQAAAMEKY